MSTNFYLYPSEGIRRGLSREDLVEVHVAKRHFMGRDVGMSYTVQAVNLDGDETDESVSDYRVPNFPRIESWRDWVRFLFSEPDTWEVIDEYGSPVPIHHFINNVRYQGSRDLPHQRFIEWLSDRGYVMDHGHYLDEEGFSVCSREFS